MRIVHLLLIGLAVTACASSTSSKNPLLPEAAQETAAQLIQHAQQDNKAYQIVESLTTEIGPRLAGSAAEERARRWAVQTLNELGLQNVRIEPFELPLWQRGEEHAAIVSPYPQSLTITTLGGSASTGPGGVQGQVKAFDSLQAMKQADADSLAGKILFVDEVMARSQDGSGYSIAVRKRREAAYEAQRLGASAVLIRSVGTSSHRFAHTGQMRRVSEGGPVGVPAAALSAPDADQLRRALSRGHPVVVKLVLTPQQLPLGSSGNVIAEIPGREVPDEIVLIGAHLDSWDLGTGAIDDGAGVGIILGAASLLLEHLDQPPRRTIRIVLFGAEEVGLVGASAYAKQHAQELPLHVVATESDFGAGDIWRYDTGVPEHAVANALAIGAVLQPLGIDPGDNTATGGPDITFLRQAGVPVVGLKQNGLDYFDLHHTADDTLDKISPRALNQNVAAYAAFMYLAAELKMDFR